MQSATLSPSTLTAASPLHAARNSLMTDTFKKHQIVACQCQIMNKKGGLVAHKLISQQLKCSLYLYDTYPPD